MLQQFNALAQLRRIDQLTVDPQGNPVVNFTLWKYYVLFRLSHFSMQKINGTEVSKLSEQQNKNIPFQGIYFKWLGILSNHDIIFEKYCFLKKIDP